MPRTFYLYKYELYDCTFIGNAICIVKIVFPYFSSFLPNIWHDPAFCCFKYLCHVSIFISKIPFFFLLISRFLVYFVKLLVWYSTFFLTLDFIFSSKWVCLSSLHLIFLSTYFIVYRVTVWAIYKWHLLLDFQNSHFYFPTYLFPETIALV